MRAPEPGSAGWYLADLAVLIVGGTLMWMARDTLWLLWSGVFHWIMN